MNSPTWMEADSQNNHKDDVNISCGFSSMLFTQSLNRASSQKFQILWRRPNSRCMLPQMTFVELFLFLAAVAGLYYLMRPLQQRLESYLRRLFKARCSRPGSVIDITDYSKKDKKP